MFSRGIWRTAVAAALGVLVLVCGLFMFTMALYTKATEGSLSTANFAVMDDFLAEASIQDVPPELRDDVVARGIIMHTTVERGLPFGIGHNAWRGYLYTGEYFPYKDPYTQEERLIADDLYLEVDEEGGAYGFDVRPGDYVAVIANGTNDLGNYPARAFIVLKRQAVTIPNNQR